MFNRFRQELDSRMIAAISAEADRIVERAKKNASWSERIPNAISRDPAIKTDTGYEVSIKIDASEDGPAPHAAAFEYGSGLRGSERDYYLIEPREGNTKLVIPRSRWPKYVEDQDDEHAGIYRDPIILSWVWHPGVKPRPYLKPAIDAERKNLYRNIGRFFRQVISDAMIRVEVIK